VYVKVLLAGRAVDPMNNKNQAMLTSHQLTTILIGALTTLDILCFPNTVVPTARQDAWISVALGNIYPIYLLLICLIIAQKYPEDNILKLSNICFGKILGNTLNLIFLGYFLLIETILATGFSNVLRVFISFYIENNKILLTVFLVPAFVAYKGLKTLGRMTKIIFYLTLPIVLIPLSAIKFGTILNIMPLFGSGAFNILKAVKEAITAYTGMELLFILYPFLNNKNKLKSCGIISILFNTALYTWFTFITIYYLGVSLIPKFLWPALAVSESVSIPIIESFRFLTLSFWFFMTLRSLSIFYYAISFGLTVIYKKINIKCFIYFLLPVCFGISMLYGSPTISRTILSKIQIPYIVFNITYVTAIAILLKVKRGETRNVS
jgi:spore germination protein